MTALPKVFDIDGRTVAQRIDALVSRIFTADYKVPFKAPDLSPLPRVAAPSTSHSARPVRATRVGAGVRRSDVEAKPKRAAAA